MASESDRSVGLQQQHDVPLSSDRRRVDNLQNVQYEADRKAFRNKPKMISMGEIQMESDLKAA